jgi:predicted secreted protein
MDKISQLQRSLRDARGMKVVFLSHCILNENTRYLGGARSPACVEPIVQECIGNDWGIVQLPCPEQRAWGGVVKRLMLKAYGAENSLLYRFRAIVVPAFVLYSKWLYRRLARQVAREIEDYVKSGFTVVGIVAIDGSPTCGLSVSLDLRASFARTATMEVAGATIANMNEIICETLVAGNGLFTAALRDELDRRHLEVPYFAHDLVAEISGKPTRTPIFST